MDGSTYEGEWANGFYHGKGEMKLPTGMTYKGDWVHGFKEGYGVLTMPDKIIISCAYVQDKKHGAGKIQHPNGKIEDTLFIHDFESKKSNQNPDCYLLMWVNLTLCLISIAFFIAAEASGIKELNIPACIFWVI